MESSTLLVRVNAADRWNLVRLGAFRDNYLKAVATVFGRGWGIRMDDSDRLKQTIGYLPTSLNLKRLPARWTVTPSPLHTH